MRCLTLCLFAALAFSLVAAAPLPNPELELRQVQVMHRHGARGAITSDNETLVCRGAEHCGELNDEGKSMLVALGAYLRANYAGPLGLGESYSQYQSYTRSTDLDRTIQSADGLLRGLFPNMSAYYPVVNTVNFETDLLLLSDAQMSFTIPKDVKMAPGFELPDEFYTRISHADLRAAGLELYQWGLCDKQAFTNDEYEKCALRVQDIAASWNAEGRVTPEATPVINRVYSDLSWLRRTYNTPLYTFNPSNEVQRQRGSIGYTLAAEILSTMYRATGTNTTSGQVFFEWSAHDTTYMPLAAAIGFNDDAYMLPLFGQAFIFELYVNKSAPADAAERFVVRILSGQPTQRPGNHSYTFGPVPVQGLAPHGTAFAASPQTLDAFGRLVNSTAPESWRGVCYLSKDVLKKIECESVHPAKNKYCIMYRQRCPQAACPNDYVMNTGDLSCVAVTPKELMTSGSAAVMIVSSALAGILLGAAGFAMGGHLCRMCRSKKTDVDMYDTVQD